MFKYFIRNGRLPLPPQKNIFDDKKYFRPNFLKVIKTHMSSLLSHVRLEAFGFFKFVSKVMMSVDYDKTIDKLAEQSDVYRKILKY